MYPGGERVGVSSYCVLLVPRVQDSRFADSIGLLAKTSSRVNNSYGA